MHQSSGKCSYISFVWMNRLFVIADHRGVIAAYSGRAISWRSEKILCRGDMMGRSSLEVAVLIHHPTTINCISAPVLLLLRCCGAILSSMTLRCRPTQLTLLVLQRRTANSAIIVTANEYCFTGRDRLRCCNLSINNRREEGRFDWRWVDGQKTERAKRACEPEATDKGFAFYALRAKWCLWYPSLPTSSVTPLSIFIIRSVKLALGHCGLIL